MGGARLPHVLQQQLALLVRHFERARKPRIQRSVHQRIAEKEHEHDRQQRNSHRAQHHLRFEARAHLSRAPLSPHAQQSTRQNQRENEQRDADEGGERKEDDERVPLFRVKWRVERAQRENRCGEQHHRDSAGDQPYTLFSCRCCQRPSCRYLPRGHSSHFGSVLRHQFLPAATISA